MAFVWKEHKDIWKGEGIYHLTFTVVGRHPLLGQLVGLDTPTVDGHIARVEPTELGFAVSQIFKTISNTYPWIQLYAKQVMPDHVHVVLYAHGNVRRSIKQVAHGIRLWAGKLAREMGVIDGLQFLEVDGGGALGAVEQPKDINNNIDDRNTIPANVGGTIPAKVGSTTPVDVGSTIPADVVSTTPAEVVSTIPADVVYKRGAYHAPQLFDEAFIRTLSHKGQLDRMIKYVHSNPDAAWMRHLN